MQKLVNISIGLINSDKKSPSVKKKYNLLIIENRCSNSHYRLISNLMLQRLDSYHTLKYGILP